MVYYFCTFPKALKIVCLLLPSILFQCGCHCEQQAPNLVDNIRRRSTVCNLGPYLPYTISAFHQLDSTAKQWTPKQVKLLHLFLNCANFVKVPARFPSFVLAQQPHLLPLKIQTFNILILHSHRGSAFHWRKKW